MPAIFLSYRREDSAGYTGRLYDGLCARFGAEKVFMDVDGIKPGDDFVKVLDDSEKNSAALIVVIGRSWLTIPSAEGKPRLFDPQDFVRREINAGLQGKVQIFPVLVGGATMPQQERLPEDLAPLARLQALVLSDITFHRDVNQLYAALDQIVSPPPPSADFAGVWQASVKYEWGATHNEVFRFELEDGEILGTASFLETARAIQDVQISGNKITFRTKSFSTDFKSTQEMRHHYSGKLVDGELRFRMQTETDFDTRLPLVFIASRGRAL